MLEDSHFTDVLVNYSQYGWLEKPVRWLGLVVDCLLANFRDDLSHRMPIPKFGLLFLGCFRNSHLLIGACGGEMPLHPKSDKRLHLLTRPEFYLRWHFF